jgi:hypothetical protein
MILRPRALALLCAAWLLAGRPAVAGKVEELSRILAEDASFKVRVQAALLLGKLGDRGAAEALIRALGDDHKMVRGTAAQSLGRLGAPEAVPALRALIARERDGFVRGQAEKALAALGPAQGEPSGRGKIYLRFGPFSGGARGVSPGLLDALRGALQKELGKLATVTFSLDGDEKSFGKSGRLGFLIDGNVTRLDDGVVGGAVEINCDVKVMVARWPSKSIILWTNAGAAVQGGSRGDKEGARRDCIEATAGQLGEDLAKFFQSQGG